MSVYKVNIYDFELLGPLEVKPETLAGIKVACAIYKHIRSTPDCM